MAYEPPPPPQPDPATIAALRKQQAGGKLNRSEQSKVDRYKAARDEHSRWAHYRTVPKKHWQAMSGRQQKILNEQALLYEIPTLDGPTIDLFAVIRWLHDFLAANGRKLLTEDDQLLDSSVGGPAIERLRLARAQLAELDLAQRREQVVSREKMHQVLGQVAAMFRSGGERLQKSAGGADAYEIHEQMLDDVERLIEREFAEGTGDGSEVSNQFHEEE